MENIWSQSKYGDLANHFPDNITQLHDTLDDLFHRYRYDPSRLDAFFQAAKLIL